MLEARKVRKEWITRHELDDGPRPRRVAGPRALDIDEWREAADGTTARPAEHLVDRTPILLGGAPRVALRLEQREQLGAAAEAHEGSHPLTNRRGELRHAATAGRMERVPVPLAGPLGIGAC